MTEIGRLQAKITAEDSDYIKKMLAADKLGATTAGKIKSSFANLKLSMPSISGIANLGSIANIAGGNLLSSALGKLTAGMTEAVKTGIDYNKMLESSSVAFETLGMSASQTKQHIADLQQLALKTPFDFQDLVKASLTMNAFGFSTQTRVKDLKELSDAAAIAAAGTGNFTEALEGVIMALGQMRAKGKVSAEEMNQLAERGIPAWDILAKKIGKTKEEVMKLSERGQLKGDVAASLLTEGMGQFAGGAGDKLANTVLGKESNLRDALMQQAGALGKDTFDAYSAGLDSATRGAQSKNAAKAGKGLDKVVSSNMIMGSEIMDALTLTGNQGGKDSVIDSFKELGADAWRGFIENLTKDNAGLVKSVEGWVQSAKDVLGVKSPSTVFAAIADDVVAGFDQGIARNIDRSSEGFKQWAEQIKRIGGDAFIKAVEEMSARLKIDPNKVMNVMAFESRLNPKAKNPNSTGTGLIQFMEGTAEGLGTTVEKLRSMNAIDQLAYVEKYFARFKNLADTQEAVYSAVLAGHGVKSADQTLFLKGGANTSQAYAANRKLDTNHDDKITAAEAASKVLAQGFLTPTSNIVQIFGQSVKTFSDTVLKVGNLGATGQGAQRGQVIPGGGASVDIISRQDLIALAEVPEDFKKLSDATTAASAALNPLPVPLKQIAENGPQAAAGMNAVTLATKDQIKALQGTNHVKDLQEKLGKDFDDLVTQLEGGQQSVTDTLRGFVRSFATDVLKELESSLMEGLTGEKSFGAYLGKMLGSLLGGLLGFGHAAGGPVKAGMVYPVGEKGPELFAPGQNGYIIPNNDAQKMMQGGGGGKTFINNQYFQITAPGGRVAPQTQQQIAAKSGAAVQHAMNRNG